MARLLAYTSPCRGTCSRAVGDVPRAAPPRPRGPRAHPGGPRSSGSRARAAGRAGRSRASRRSSSTTGAAVAGRRHAADRERVRASAPRSRSPTSERAIEEVRPDALHRRHPLRGRAATSPRHRACRGRSSARTRRRCGRGTRRRTGWGSARHADRPAALRDRSLHAVGDRLPAPHVCRRSTSCGQVSACRRSRSRRPVRCESDRFIAFTAEPYEYPRSDWPAHVRLVGPGPGSRRPSRRPGSPPRRRPIVLVTASTAYQRDEQLIATALEAFAGEDVALVVTTAAHDPAPVRGAAERARRAVPAPRPDHRARRVRRVPRRAGHHPEGARRRRPGVRRPVLPRPVRRRPPRRDRGRRRPPAPQAPDPEAPARRRARGHRQARRAPNAWRGRSRAAGGAAAAADAVEELLAYASATANRCHCSGTPLSSCAPRSSKSIPEPATRSFTVLETSTSPALRQRADARADVHGHPADVVAHDLALAGVQAGAHVDAERRTARCAIARAQRIAARRTVERGEEAVAHRLDLAAAGSARAARARARRGDSTQRRASGGRPARPPGAVESTMSVNITVASTRRARVACGRP